MAGYQHIVFATDLTDAAGPAAQRVAQQAGCAGGRVTLLHVIEHYPDALSALPEGPDPEARLMEETGRKLSDFAGRHGLEAAQVEVRLTRYSARQAILDYLREAGADLVVLGVIGHPGQLGTTVDDVAANAPCDVLIIQGGAWQSGLG